MSLRILKIGDPSLHGRATPVQIIGPSESQLCDTMVSTMRRANGVGLAAPQVGVQLRIVVIEVPAGHESHDHTHWDWNSTQIFRLVNPMITYLGEYADLREGCLSLPGFTTTVPRAGCVSVKATRLDGTPLRIDARGLLAQALQHEIDHLDGRLVSDRVGSILAMRQVPPPWITNPTEQSRRPTETTPSLKDQKPGSIPSA